MSDDGFWRGDNTVEGRQKEWHDEIKTGGDPKQTMGTVMSLALDENARLQAQVAQLQTENERLKWWLYQMGPTISADAIDGDTRGEPSWGWLSTCSVSITEAESKEWETLLDELGDDERPHLTDDRRAAIYSDTTRRFEPKRQADHFPIDGELGEQL